MDYCKNCKRWTCGAQGTSHEMPIPCGNYIPQTNADRIRSMTDEELAQWLDDISKACYYEGYTKETDEPQMSPYPTSPAKWVTWLKKEARDGKD